MIEKNKTRKELIVSAIDDGTVIDHIPARSLFQVIKILNLERFENQVLFGTNLDSKKYQKKALIKVRNKFFKIDEINKIALVAPTATIIVIKNYDVIKKIDVEIPDQINNLVKCFNPNCITNHEKIPTKFTVIDKDELQVQCHYCEKIMEKEEIVFL